MINTSHYYGDIVRRLFLGAAALMLITLPFLQSFIPFPIFVSSFAALVITLCAGLIAPGRAWIVFLNLLVAGGGVLVFEYYAVTSYFGGTTTFFLTNQTLALLFFIAFYYAVKTARGELISRP